jgi:hypothetical protein
MAITRIGNPALADVREPNFRNIIINGNMAVSQRGTSQASITTSGYYTLDRARTAINNGGTWTQSQSTEVPTGQGFATSLKMDCTTADTSLSSGDYLHVQYPIEAQNLQYLKYGTDSAQTLTLSFWVRSNKTGTYCICLQKSDNTRYDYVAEYSISSADTWEKKTIIIAPDSNIKAAGGAIDNDSGEGLKLKFTLLSSGRTGTNNTWNSSTPADATSNQVNLADSTSNEWYVTGVQIEAGSVATDFEVVPYDVNLRRCQRYYHLIDDGDITSGIGVATSYTATTAYLIASLNPEMRTTPSIDQVSGTSYYNYLNESTGKTFNSFSLSATNSTNKFVRINNAENISITAGTSGWFKTNDTSAYIAFDAEL